ncbi:MAG: RsmE family RNA methyltransferase [Victivallaceae bacterium]|nr:RsmE family RNA methyltransferase [Victivallaceae bacterium]
MHNFFVDAIGKPGEEVLFPQSEMKHLFKTLRAAPGDMIGLLDGKGARAEAELAGDKKIIIRKLTEYPEPETKIHLFVAAPKRNALDQLLRQCTEAGVWSIHPLITRYSVAAPEKISDRWRSLLQEACKQSGNIFLPELNTPCSLDQAMEKIKSTGMAAFYGAVSESGRKLPQVSADIAWLVGPEGGFSEEEERKMSACGVAPLHIGPYIMRVETAAVCGVALLNFATRM